MHTVPCPHCAAPIRRTATFCLACDRRVVDTDRGLSVAEAVPTSVGRPLVGLVVGVACLVLLGGAVYGGLRIFRNADGSAAGQASSDVRQGLALVVSAEGGDAGACGRLGPLVAGPATTTLSECRALVGEDRGARLGRVSVAAPQLATGKGTAQVHATVTDGSGIHTVDEVVHLVDVHRHWRMTWNGQPVGSPHVT